MTATVAIVLSLSFALHAVVVFYGVTRIKALQCEQNEMYSDYRYVRRELDEFRTQLKPKPTKSPSVSGPRVDLGFIELVQTPALPSFHAETFGGIVNCVANSCHVDATCTDSCTCDSPMSCE